MLYWKMANNKIELQEVAVEKSSIELELISKALKKIDQQRQIISSAHFHAATITNLNEENKRLMADIEELKRVNELLICKYRLQYAHNSTEALKLENDKLKLIIEVLQRELSNFESKLALHQGVFKNLQHESIKLAFLQKTFKKRVVG